MTKSGLKNTYLIRKNYRDAVAFAHNISEQMQMAGAIQRDFLPSKMPNSDRLHWAANFLPAEWVSGDIYDIARIDERHIGFYIADVVGHGIPAAFLTIFLKQALSMRQTVGDRYRIFSPAEVMANLNTRLIEQKLSGNQFITCCYCLLNTETLKMTYARGGHPYPILIRPGQRPQQLEIKGALLGIFEKVDFGQSTVQLLPGDKVLLYSDGAEPFIGGFDEIDGIKFTEQFLEATEMAVDEMTERLNVLAQEIDTPEIDDITTVTLEIL